MSATILGNSPIARAMDHAFGLGQTLGLGHTMGFGHALGHDQYLSTRTHSLVAARAYDHARQAVARRVPAEPAAAPVDRAVAAPVADTIAAATITATDAAAAVAAAAAQPQAAVPGRATLPPWRGLLALL